jgi:hypothetical protein
MKKTFAALLVFAFTLTTAHAATTGTLTLSGTIATLISIVVTPDANASALDLTANAANLQVAVVTENSNAVNGYKIKAKSANAGTIKHASLADNVAYTLKYGAGSAVTLTAADQDVKTQATGGTYSGVNSNVTISYTGSSALTAGAYSDTITFTIEAL